MSSGRLTRLRFPGKAALVAVSAFACAGFQTIGWDGVDRNGKELVSPFEDLPPGASTVDSCRAVHVVPDVGRASDERIQVALVCIRGMREPSSDFSQWFDLDRYSLDASEEQYRAAPEFMASLIPRRTTILEAEAVTAYSLSAAEPIGGLIDVYYQGCTEIRQVNTSADWDEPCLEIDDCLVLILAAGGPFRGNYYCRFTESHLVATEGKMLSDQDILATLRLYEWAGRQQLAAAARAK